MWMVDKAPLSGPAPPNLSCSIQPAAALLTVLGRDVDGGEGAALHAVHGVAARLKDVVVNLCRHSKMDPSL